MTANLELITQRDKGLQALREHAGPWDVIVIGGGIVGAGVVRDAAMRGLRVALIEQQDLAAGTSSRSSRLLHGGIRYLAQGRVGLVRQASREKMAIHRIAPHLVQPLPFIFPTRRGGPWKLWKLKLGVRVYDWLCGSGNFGAAGGLSVEALQSRLPCFDATDYSGAVRYFDALTNDARLVIDTCRSAELYGATVMNYVRADNITARGRLWEIALRDLVAGHDQKVTAHCVINACGPWADQWPAARCKLRLTKGVHLVVDRARLNTPEAVVLTEGTRILFVLPWGRRVILGTTDTEYQGDPREPLCDSADLRYILGVVNGAFPGAKLSAADVRSTWAGLRPLVWSGRGGASDISRAHTIRMSDPGWFDVTGGKLTTYRLMAEQAVDQIKQYRGRAAPPCRTAHVPLLETADEAKYSGVLPPEPTRACVEHYCRREWVVSLADVMERRTSWAFYESGDEALALRVAGWMAPCLGWSEQRAKDEIARYAARRSARMAASAT